MTSMEARLEFDRFKAQGFRLSADAVEAEVFAEFFRALSHYAVEAVHEAVSETIHAAKDQWWPAVGVISEKIRARLAGLPRTRAECETCKGSTWVQVAPMKALGCVYEGVVRCPDCGVPAPTLPERHLEPLSAVEYQQWMSGEHPQQTAPHQPPKARRAKPMEMTTFQKPAVVS